MRCTVLLLLTAAVAVADRGPAAEGKGLKKWRDEQGENKAEPMRK
jgi:hypothetical protein